MNRKTLLIPAFMFAVLCLLSSPVIGKCQKVRMHLKSCEMPSNCGSYEICEICKYEGTPNATVRAFWNQSDAVFLPNALVVPVAAFYETNQGEIWSDVVVTIHFDALTEFDNGLAISGYYYGGTDKYEGITGWLAGAGVPQEGNSASVHGEICWPDEE